ncbi:hypothetical protein Dimus_015867 [Dionaea muscipula]
MLGIMAATYPRERMATLLDSVDFATAIPSKLEQLRRLKEELPLSDTVLLSEFLSAILKLHADQFSPVRKVATDRKINVIAISVDMLSGLGLEGQPQLNVVFLLVCCMGRCIRPLCWDVLNQMLVTNFVAVASFYVLDNDDISENCMCPFHDDISDKMCSQSSFAIWDWDWMIGELGLRHLEFLPEIVPTLMNIMEDDVPAVVRQAISSGIDLFCATLSKVAVQTDESSQRVIVLVLGEMQPSVLEKLANSSSLGLHTSELDDVLESAWAWMLKLKEKIYSIAFQPGSDGRRLIALKFIEAVILIYTPDPNGTPEPPPNPITEGKLVQFNISWIRRGHPALKIGDLSIEASQSLGFLLDQLRFPAVKSQSTSMVIVLVNCLSDIAKKRPSFYGRILPVLLGLDASNSAVKTADVYGMQHALKKAFVSCLQCKHPSATPWRDRLVGALKDMKVGRLLDTAPELVSRTHGIVKEEKDGSQVKMEDATMAEVCDPSDSSAGRKRSGGQEFAESSEEGDTPKKRSRNMSVSIVVSAEHLNNGLVDVGVCSTEQEMSHGEGDHGPVQQLVSLFGALVAQGEKAVGSLDILISSISADLLAEVVMANMRHLPSISPNVEEPEDLPSNIVLDNGASFRQLSSLISHALSSGTSLQVVSLADAQLATFDEIQKHPGLGGHIADVVSDRDELCASINEGAEEILGPAAPDASIDDGNLLVSKGYSSLTTEFENAREVDSIIPGLSELGDGLADTVISSSLASTYVESADQDQVENVEKRSPLDQVPSTSTDRSEELSPKAAAADITSAASSTPTSLGSVQQFMIPKMSAPIIDLAEKQKDFVQNTSFVRIIDAYKHVAAAGGSQLRFSLLAYLGVEVHICVHTGNLPKVGV